MNDFPSEFTSPMRETTDALHEMFLSLMESGFNEAQALYMLGVMLGSNNGDRDS